MASAAAPEKGAAEPLSNEEIARATEEFLKRESFRQDKAPECIAAGSMPPHEWVADHAGRRAEEQRRCTHLELHVSVENRVRVYRCACGWVGTQQSLLSEDQRHAEEADGLAEEGRH